MEIDSEVSGLSPETKEFFEQAGKPEKKKEADPAQKPEEKPEQKSDAPTGDPKAKSPEKKQEAPKDAPDVEKQRLQSAMHEERERRKEIAEQLKREGEERKRLEDKFNRFLSMLQEQEKAPPEFDKDPAGHLKAREEANARELAELKKWREEREQMGQQEAELARFRGHVASQTQAFVAETPDYGDAYSYVRDRRTKELEALGVPAEHIGALVNQWEMQLAAAAVQLGKNPAAVLYAQAQLHGYAKKAVADPGASEKSKLEALARGAEAAKSGPSGEQGPAPLTLERIRDMDEDEMQELVRGKGWNKVAKLFKT